MLEGNIIGLQHTRICCWYYPRPPYMFIFLYCATAASTQHSRRQEKDKPGRWRRHSICKGDFTEKQCQWSPLSLPCPTKPQIEALIQKSLGQSANTLDPKYRPLIGHNILEYSKVLEEVSHDIPGWKQIVGCRKLFLFYFPSWWLHSGWYQLLPPYLQDYLNFMFCLRQYLPNHD